MKLSELLIFGLVMLVTIMVIFGVIASIVREHALMTLEISRAEISSNVERVIRLLLRCVDPRTLTPVNNGEGLRIRGLSCIHVSQIQQDTSSFNLWIFHLPSYSEAAPLYTMAILAKRAGLFVRMVMDSCEYSVGFPKPSSLNFYGKAVGGLCPPRQVGLGILRTSEPVFIEIHRNPASIKVLDKDDNLLYSNRLDAVHDVDWTLAVANRQYYAFFGGTEMLRYDLDEDGDGFLEVGESPVIRPVLRDSVTGLVLWFVVDSPFRALDNAACGRNIIHAGERKQCLTLRIQTI